MRIIIVGAAEELVSQGAAKLALLLAQAHHGLLGCEVEFQQFEARVESAVDTVEGEVEAVAHSALTKIKALFGMADNESPSTVVDVVTATTDSADKALDALRRVAVAVGGVEAGLPLPDPNSVVTAVEKHVESAAVASTALQNVAEAVGAVNVDSPETLAPDAVVAAVEAHVETSRAAANTAAVAAMPSEDKKD